jgi:L-alanine-DL-glutamate epimerase-like enolase superfamily enzyme
MKITDIKTESLQLPFVEPLTAAYGERTHSTIVLVSIETDEG